MINNIIKVVVVVVVVVVLLLLLRKQTSLAISYKEMNDITNAEFTVERDKHGMEIAKMRQIELRDKDNIKRLMQEVEGLKVKSQVRVVTNTVIKKDTVFYPDSIYVEIEGSRYLQLPFVFSEHGRWFGYKFTVDSNFVARDTLYFVSEPVISYGWKKNKWHQFFKPKEGYVAYQDNNPDAHVVDFKNYVIHEPKRRLRLGVSAGYFLTPKGLQPGIGIGVGY